MQSIYLGVYAFMHGLAATMCTCHHLMMQRHAEGMVGPWRCGIVAWYALCGTCLYNPTPSFHRYFRRYGRHRTMWRQHGESALRAELMKDVNRLWKRNLGRDDRVISDSGREARHPFLDEAVMRFLTDADRLPTAAIADMTLPPGKGDKWILRYGAHVYLGLAQCSRLQKRAMQFGSRIANNKVAGYVPMTDAVRIEHIVHPTFLKAYAAAEAVVGGRGSSRRGSQRREGSGEENSSGHGGTTIPVRGSAELDHTASASVPSAAHDALEIGLTKRFNKRQNKPGFE